MYCVHTIQRSPLFNFSNSFCCCQCWKLCAVRAHALLLASSYIDLVLFFLLFFLSLHFCLSHAFNFSCDCNSGYALKYLLNFCFLLLFRYQQQQHSSPYIDAMRLFVGLLSLRFVVFCDVFSSVL